MMARSYTGMTLMAKNREKGKVKIMKMTEMMIINPEQHDVTKPEGGISSAIGVDLSKEQRVNRCL